jgi:hypothetical protein
MNETPYDSREDTLNHILRVRELLYIVQGKMEARGFAHDQSKLSEPEKSTFDACTAKLKAMAYGSDEYKTALSELKPALDHHYAANAHHPEHFKLWKCPLCKTVYQDGETVPSACYASNPRFCKRCTGGHAIFEATLEPHIGIDGMSLIDVVEMLVDWKAATERMKGGGDIHRSLELNTTRFNLSPQLVSILANTIEEMGWQRSKKESE